MLVKALKYIFYYGCIPTEDSFVIIDNSEEELYKWTLDPEIEKETVCVVREQAEALLWAADKIMSYVPKELDGACEHEILTYVAERMPEVFSEGTKYAQD